MSLPARLKKETATAHQNLEKQLVPFMKKVNSAAAYGRLLQFFYGFTAPAEHLLDKNLVHHPISYSSQRRKADWILADLNNLSDYHEKQTFCQNLPDISNAAEAMGMLYVLEGSTLGGSIIAKMLQSKLSHVPEATYQFFEGYKEKTFPYWNAFRDDLMELPESQHQACIDAANQTFEAFSEWASIQLDPTLKKTI